MDPDRARMQAPVCKAGGYAGGLCTTDAFCYTNNRAWMVPRGARSDMHTVKVRGDYVEGRFLRPRGSDQRIVSKDPGDAGYRIGTFPVVSDHVGKAVEAARIAGADWRRRGPEQRADMLRKFAAEVVNHRDELKELIAAETGKPLWEAEGEVQAVEGQVESELREGVRAVADFQVGEVSWGLQGRCAHRPLGVAAVLGPAISPVHLSCAQLLPALITGNTVVYKPSKLVPATGQFIARLFDQIELPPGVFNLIQGDAATGSALAVHDDVDAVLFTGSVPAGRRILQATADQDHKLVALQLGGVCVALVLDDADIDRSVYETTLGSYLTTGQQYTSTGVVLVDRPVAERFTEAFVEVAASLGVGYAFDPGVFMGPMLTGSARDRYLDLQEQLDRAGVRALLPSRKLDASRPGYYVGPAVHLAENPDSIDAIRPGGLSFGPDVILVPVDGHEAAVALANRNRRPLAASVFTEDARRFEVCADELAYGVINHNTATTSVSLRLPLQGGDGCGNHRPGGVFTQRNCTRPVSTLRSTTAFDPERMVASHPMKKA